MILTSGTRNSRFRFRGQTSNKGNKKEAGDRFFFCVQSRDTKEQRDRNRPDSARERGRPGISVSDQNKLLRREASFLYQVCGRRREQRSIRRYNFFNSIAFITKSPFLYLVKSIKENYDEIDGYL